MKFEDLSGKTFNKLTVIKRIYKAESKTTLWICRCECGKETIVSSPHLKDGHTKSCGCLQRESVKAMMEKHGLSKEPLYKVYRGIIDRTSLKSSKNYKDYGGRGIKVCNEWRNDFKSFYDWSISHGYEKGLSIDRIDVNGDYCPENCRWVTMKIQQNNRRNNRLISYNGETHTMKEWSEIIGVGYSTLSMRLNKLHWNIERVLSC